MTMHDATTLKVTTFVRVVYFEVMMKRTHMYTPCSHRQGVVVVVVGRENHRSEAGARQTKLVLPAELCLGKVEDEGALKVGGWLDDLDGLPY